MWTEHSSEHGFMCVSKESQAGILKSASSWTLLNDHCLIQSGGEERVGH